MNLESLVELAGLPTPLPEDPMPTLARWLEEARRGKATPNPDAFVLATVEPGGAPSARVVLCKGLDVERGRVRFFTSYLSRKGAQIEAGGAVAGVFHWDAAGRQARVEGVARRISPQESDAYFASRPLLSKLGAWASEQSRPLGSRGELLASLRRAMERFGVSAVHLVVGGGPEIPRPPTWGGYDIELHAVELWVGGSGRLHDRALWRRSAGTGWSATRLQP